MGGTFTRERAASTGSDVAAFIDSIAPKHKPTFDALYQLVMHVEPQVQQSVKWGTLALDLDGSLFALSANKKTVNLYVLTQGVIAAHQDLLAGIPQSHCVLRFAPDAEVPLPALETVLRAALVAKHR